MEILDLKRDERSFVSFSVRLNREEWEPYLARASKKLQKQRKLPGFRSGAAPLKLAEANYGKALYETAALEAQNELLIKACEEKSLEPVSEPKAAVVLADKTGFECIFSFFNYPEITELNYLGLSAEKPRRAVTEADIDREIGNFLRNHLKVEETDAAARMGDIVEVSFTGTVDGHGFDFDSSEKSRFILGSGQLFAGLDENLEGHKAGESLELSLTMPKDFHRDNIAGLTVDLKVKLLGVWARDMQELSDELVSKNVKDCATVAEYRDQLKTRIEAVYDSRSEAIFRKNLETSLADAVKDPVPQAMVNTNFERYIAGLFGAAKAQGVTPEELLRNEGRTPEEYQRELMELSRKQVYFSVAADHIAHAENISVSDEEVAAFCAGNAAAMGVDEDKAQELMGGLEGVRQELITRKVMAVVYENAVRVEKEVDSLPGEDRSIPVLVN